LISAVGIPTAAEATRHHGLTVAGIEQWHDRVLLKGEDALRARHKGGDALCEEELNRLRRNGERVDDGPGYIATKDGTPALFGAGDVIGGGDVRGIIATLREHRRGA